ncbi:hypothetical protein [Pollutimonas harenae]|uniref:Strictosidine synthase n=1 Tax=Pollutimonas harenae TaxID=657015 RepID=A0A853GUS1_9BURK|nr:hypothetical protein [Pollutimonas harenae]NYT86928.1 hypothetical protein [Pollutimonas harenae]TEA69360.1 hypothetical protein ERD84_15005 [Pollutimonas harenae]
MFKTLKRAHNRFFGVGEADTSVPVLDGALKPNNILEKAQVFFERAGLEDMVVNGNGQLIAACGRDILQIDPDGDQHLIAQLSAPAQALAVFRDGLVAATQDGLSFIMGSFDGKQVHTLEGQAVQCINAMHEGPGGSLLISQGSSNVSYADWTTDLLSRGKSGRILEYDPQSDSCRVRAQGLAYCYGVCFDGSRIIASETWAHRLRVIQGETVEIGPSQIAGYPSRISRASDGGFWLTIFAPRSQLLEFVLREDAFRSEMMQTIEPQYWIAPALSSGSDFLEPLQQGGVRQMGILKPWAPPRSYGLVLRLSKDLEPLYSVHSRVGGLHHGITAALEFDGALLALSKGSGRILRVPLSELNLQD